MGKNNWFERNPGKTLTGVIVILVVAIDFLAANIYKSVKGYPWFYREAHERERAENIARQRAMEIERSYRVVSPFYNHDLAKNKFVESATYGPVKYRIHTNSLGFKDRRIREVPLICVIQRILVMGDSFTEGIGVEYKNTFAGIIEDEFLKKGVEVLNAAVAGYSPIIYYKKAQYLIEEAGLEFDELVVFLDISDAKEEVLYYFNEDGNVAMRDAVNFIKREEIVAGDAEAGYDTSESEKARHLSEWVKSNSMLVSTILYRVYSIYFKKEIDTYVERPPHGAGTLVGQWTLDSKLYEKFGKKGLEKMRIYMDRLYDLLKKHDIALTVVVYPWPDQVLDGNLDSVYVSFWENWCRERGVGFLNYFPCFILEGSNEKARIELLDRYFIKDDMHWNKKGHRFVAEVFLNYYGKRTAGRPE